MKLERGAGGNGGMGDGSTRRDRPDLPGTPSADAGDQTVLNRAGIIRERLEAARPEAALDAGCGLGVYLPLLASFGAEVVGADIIHDHLRQIPAAKSIRRVCSALEAAAFHSAAFDFVICIETLEHVRDDERTLRELRRVMKPGGTLILSVPYKGFPFETHGIRLGSRTIRSPLGLGFPLLTYCPQFIRRIFATVRVYSVGGLRRMFERNGFRIREIRFLLPGLDVFERRIRLRAPARLLRGILNAMQSKLSRVWGSTIVVIGEARGANPRDTMAGE
jgi:SAM-dependent methyltransferase